VLTIREAIPDDSSQLTQISFASKNYWGYPGSYFDAWCEELTITPEYIKRNTVFAAQIKQKIVGYYSIGHIAQDLWVNNIFVKNGFWLDHMFILPENIGQGVGTLLCRHIVKICPQLGCSKLLIFVDSNSKGFYDKVGATYIEEVPSSIEGRTVSFFEWNTLI
jgi:GNAT superfamily N-acetyltransferase